MTRHELKSLDHEDKTHTQLDTPDGALGHVPPYELNETAEAEKEEDQSHPEVGRDDLLGGKPNRDGIGTDDLHGLNRDRDPEIESCEDVKETDGTKDIGG